MPKVPPSAKCTATPAEIQESWLSAGDGQSQGISYTVVRFHSEYSIADLKMSTEFENWLHDEIHLDLTEDPIPLTGGELTVRFFGTVREYARTNGGERSLIKSFVIQRYGGKASEPCEHCKKALEKKGSIRDGVRYPDGLVYSVCRTISALAGGACGSCKRAHKEAECTASNVFKARVEEAKKVERQRKDSATAREKRNAVRTAVREAAQ